MSRYDDDRDFWRDYDLRRDYEREDMEYEARRRAEASERAWEAMRRGDTAEALRESVGPDAAAAYLEATSSVGSDPPPRLWTAHPFVTTLAQLTENIEAAPASARFEVEGPDTDGDIPVVVRDGEQSERFWVQQPVLSTLSVVTAPPGRVHDVVLQIVLRRGVRPFPGIDWFRRLPGSAPAGDAEAKTIDLPHVVVDELGKLVADLRAAPGAEFEVHRLDSDGDAVVNVRRGDASATFWVKGALLPQLAALAEAPAELMPLARDLARLHRDG